MSSVDACTRCGGDVEDIGETRVCTGCGLVVHEDRVAMTVELESSALDGTHWTVGQRLAQDEDGTRYRHGKYLSTRGSSAIMGPKRNDKAKSAIVKYMRTLVASLGLERSFVNQTKFLMGRYNGEKWRYGRYSELIAAACLYVICRQNRTPITLFDVAEAIRCDNYFELGRCYTKVKKTLPGLSLPDPNPVLYVDTAVSKLEGLPKEHKRRAIRMAQSLIRIAQRNWLVTGRRPGAVAAAAIGIALKAVGHGCSDRQLSEVANSLHVSVQTVRDRNSELMECLVLLGRQHLPWGQEISRKNIISHLSSLVGCMEIVHSTPTSTSSTSPPPKTNDGRDDANCASGDAGPSSSSARANDGGAHASDDGQPSGDSACSTSDAAGQQEPPWKARLRLSSSSGSLPPSFKAESNLRHQRQLKINRAKDRICRAYDAVAHDPEKAKAVLAASGIAEIIAARTKIKKEPVPLVGEEKGKTDGFLFPPLAASPVLASPQDASQPANKNGTEGEAPVLVGNSLSSSSLPPPGMGMVDGVAMERGEEKTKKDIVALNSSHKPADRLGEDDFIIEKLLWLGVSDDEILNGHYESILARKNGNSRAGDIQEGEWNRYIRPPAEAAVLERLLAVTYGKLEEGRREKRRLKEEKAQQRSKKIQRIDVDKLPSEPQDLTPPGKMASSSLDVLTAEDLFDMAEAVDRHSSSQSLTSSLASSKDT